MTRSRDELAARRARIARLQAKRPEVTIEVTHAPSTAALEDLVDVLGELLDARRRSGRW